MESTYGRKLLRVKDALYRLKESTDSAAVRFFSHLLESKKDEFNGGVFHYQLRAVAAYIVLTC